MEQTAKTHENISATGPEGLGVASKARATASPHVLRQIIRYNHLVANLVVFHNVVSMTRVLQELVDEGYPITPEIIANFSPYRTEHLNRFGSYDLRFDHEPQPVIEELRLKLPPSEVGMMG